MTEVHSVMCVQYSKLYRSIDMELSLDVKHREDVLEFVNRIRLEYDRLLDEAPDIPSNTIYEFNQMFPDKKNKPDVCNGLSILADIQDVDDESRIARAIKKWMMRPKTPPSLDVPRRSTDLESYPSCEV